MSEDIWNDVMSIAADFSRAQHRVYAIARVRRDIVDCRPRCGNCAYWMKTGDCPREHGLGSRPGGPSMGTASCKKFVESPSTTERRLAFEEKLRALETAR